MMHRSGSYYYQKDIKVRVKTMEARCIHKRKKLNYKLSHNVQKK